MEWYDVIQAVNDSIDLEKDFPKCTYFSWQEFVRRLIFMNLSGSKVV